MRFLQIIKVYIYLIERNMDDCWFNIPATFYFNIIDNKYAAFAEDIESAITERLMSKYDDETIACRGDEDGVMMRSGKY